MSNPLSDTDRQRILYVLARAYAEAVDLESRLWLGGDKKLANSAELKTDALYEVLAQLRADLWGAWTDDATEATADLKNAGERVEAAVDAVKDDIKNADRVVRALGYLDEVIQLAAKFMV